MLATFSNLSSYFNPHTGNGEGVYYPSPQAQILLKFVNLQMRYSGDIVTDTLKFRKPLSSCQYLYPFHQDKTGSADEQSEK